MGRLSYNFDLLIKSYQLGLQDLVCAHKREHWRGTRSEALNDSIRKLLPIARQIEIDVEFFNRLLLVRAKMGGAAASAPALHPDYNWCEATHQLAGESIGEALETLDELLATSTRVLGELNRVMRRESESAAARPVPVPGAGHEASFLGAQWERLRPEAIDQMKPASPRAVVDETEVLLTDGTITARFNRHMVETMGLVSAVAEPKKKAAPPAGGAAVPDAEVRALKARLEAELAEVAAMKSDFAEREKTFRAREARQLEAERVSAERRKRELLEIEEARRGLVALEERALVTARRAEEERAQAMEQVEQFRAELVARESFLEEGEQRLMNKGQEQLERLAEMEQKEDELAAIRRELNEMRREMGLPLVGLRTQAFDEFSE